jgi:transglutaminase-like putative cysteine protease
MLLHIRHETLYRYNRPVDRSVQSLRLTPRTEAGQRVLAWELQAPGRRSQQLDVFGNVMHLLSIDEPHSQIHIQVSGTVETEDVPDSSLSTRGALSPLIYVAETPLTRADAHLEHFARDHGRPPLDRDSAMQLAGTVRSTLEYVPGATEVSDTAAHAFSLRRGVCQDHAHVMLACCRLLKVPARYVSGYMLTQRDEHIASHAWVDVWLQQDNRWFAIDVTHHAPGGSRHCRMAVGRDYLDACPVRGVRRGGGQETMTAAVAVSAAAQEPRMAAPRPRLLQQRQAQQ